MCMQVEWLTNGDMWANSYIVGNILVDAGVMPMAVAPYKEQIETIVLTHCHFDHTGGAARLKNLIPGLKTVAHELDAPFLERGDNEATAADWYDAEIVPFPVDIKLSGPREKILLGDREIVALHAPGHSPGSVVYLFESEGKKVLFAQDVHGPLHPSFLSNREDYLNSLEMMLELEADILCEGHYGVFKGKAEAARFIKQFLNR